MARSRCDRFKFKRSPTDNWTPVVPAGIRWIATCQSQARTRRPAPMGTTRHPSDAWFSCRTRRESSEKKTEAWRHESSGHFVSRAPRPATTRRSAEGTSRARGPRHGEFDRSCRGENGVPSDLGPPCGPPSSIEAARRRAGGAVLVRQHANGSVRPASIDGAERSVCGRRSSGLCGAAHHSTTMALASPSFADGETYPTAPGCFTTSPDSGVVANRARGAADRSSEKIRCCAGRPEPRRRGA